MSNILRLQKNLHHFNMLKWWIFWVLHIGPYGVGLCTTYPCCAAFAFSLRKVTSSNSKCDVSNSGFRKCKCSFNVLRVPSRVLLLGFFRSKLGKFSVKLPWIQRILGENLSNLLWKNPNKKTLIQASFLCHSKKLPIRKLFQDFKML